MISTTSYNKNTNKETNCIGNIKMPHTFIGQNVQVQDNILQV